jgi:hypothetical protein
LAIHRPEITKMAPISTIPKGKRTSNFELFASREGAPFSESILTLEHSIGIPYVQPISIPLLVMASRMLFFYMSYAASLAAKPTCFGSAESSLKTPLGRGPTGRTPHC